MIYEKLSTLLAISASQEKAKVERSVKADTKKNKIALFAACENKDIQKLQSLIDLGMDINVMNERDSDSSRMTPLITCAREGWVEGLQALKEAGACDKKTPLFYYDEKGELYDLENEKTTCLEVAVLHDKAQAFSFLFQYHDEKDRIKAIQSVRSAGIFLEIHRQGYSHCLDKERLTKLMFTFIEALNPSALSEKSLLKRQCIDLCFEMLDIKNDPSLINKLWLTCLSHNQNPGMLQGLALRDLKPSEDGTVLVIPSQCLFEHDAPSFLTKIITSPTYRDQNRQIKVFSDEASKPIRMGIATAAAIKTSRYNLDTPNTLYTLCAIKELREELLSNPIGRHYLTINSYLNVKVLKRLKDHQSNMLLVTCDQGRNPLHFCVQKGESKTTIEAIARVFPEWIIQKDQSGKVPLDYEKNTTKQTLLASLFDKFAMKDVLKYRRGSRVTTEKKRRL